MDYQATYRSALGPVILASDGECLTGVWFQGQKYAPRSLDGSDDARELPVFQVTVEWLERYFSGKQPGETPPLRLTGSEFQREVWAVLRDIPYGQTRTYGDIACELAERREGGKMSARAVGGAVGHNPISILVPCHRVLGAGGQLTGYAGGIERKTALLKLEGAI